MKKNIAIIILSILVWVFGLTLAIILKQKNTTSINCQNAQKELTEENNKLKTELDLLKLKNKNDENDENKKDTADSPLEKIKKEAQTCLDKGGVDVANCCSYAIADYNDEIDKTIKNLKKVLSKFQYEKLLESQEKWQEFVKSDNNLHEKTLLACRAIMPVTIGECARMDIIEARAQELNTIYNGYPLFKEDCFEN